MKDNRTILETVRVTKDFGGLRALNHCSISVREGTITGLIGPNGAGKTTLFNAITGFIHIDKGEIYFKGVRVDNLTPRSPGRRMAYLLFSRHIVDSLLPVAASPHMLFQRGMMRTFQISRELQKMTVSENLQLVPLHQEGERFWAPFFFPGTVRSQEKEINERTEEVLDFLDLTKLKDEFAANLSTGQKKLLELGRAMMADPDIILLDEPGAGVNPTLMKKLVEHIRRLNEKGKTFLVIEHDMDLVMNLCDPVIVLNIGQKLMEGPPDEVRRDPRVLEAYLGEG